MKNKLNYILHKILDLVNYYGIGSLSIIARYFQFNYFRIVRKGSLTLTKVYGFDILIPTDNDGIGRALYVHQGRELDHKWILEQVLHAGDCILDLGANIGYYALLEAHILKNNCKILAIEPDPRNVSVLKENVRNARLEDVVTFEECAMSNYTGKACFELSSRTNLSKISESGAAGLSSFRTEVKVYDFAEYSVAQQKINLVRMDIEGGEVNIFSSIVNAKEGRSPVTLPQRIIFETHDYETKANLMHSLIGKMFLYGYMLEYLSSDDEHSKYPVFHSYGYKPTITIQEMGVSRGIYTKISLDHAAQLISDWRGTRTVCLKLLEE